MPIDGWPFVGGLGVGGAALLVASWHRGDPEAHRALWPARAVVATCARRSRRLSPASTCTTTTFRRSARCSAGEQRIRCRCRTFHRMEEAARRVLPIGQGRSWPAGRACRQSAVARRRGPVRDAGHGVGLPRRGTGRGVPAAASWFMFPHPHLPGPRAAARVSRLACRLDAVWRLRRRHSRRVRAQAHEGVAPVIVMPDVNGSWWRATPSVSTDGAGTRETYLTRRRARRGRCVDFGVAIRRGRCGRSPVSRKAATCALRSALRHPGSVTPRSATSPARTTPGPPVGLRTSVLRVRARREVFAARAGRTTRGCSSPNLEPGRRRAGDLVLGREAPIPTVVQLLALRLCRARRERTDSWTMLVAQLPAASTVSASGAAGVRTSDARG